MNCIHHQNIEAENLCDRCNASLCSNCYNYYIFPITNEHLCGNCYLSAIDNCISLGRSTLQKSIFKISLMVLGFFVGILLGLDLYFGLGILINQPINIIFIPIFLPFIIPSIFHLIVGGKKLYRKEKDTSHDDSSVGYNFLIIIFIIFRALIASPFLFFKNIFQYLSDIKKSKIIIREYNTIKNNMLNLD